MHSLRDCCFLRRQWVLALVGITAGHGERRKPQKLRKSQQSRRGNAKFLLVRHHQRTTSAKPSHPDHTVSFEVTPASQATVEAISSQPHPALPVRWADTSSQAVCAIHKVSKTQALRLSTKPEAFCSLFPTGVIRETRPLLLQAYHHTRHGLYLP